MKIIKRVLLGAGVLLVALAIAPYVRAQETGEETVKRWNVDFTSVEIEEAVSWEPPK